jgi:hypothetical protein
MKRFSSIRASALVVLLMAGLSAGPAHASESDRLLYFTFNTPVEVPGVGLPAGTYLFKLANSGSASSVVQVFSRDGRTLYSTFLTLPAPRLEAASDSTVMFFETASGAPHVIRTWFYAGDKDGLEFVYPKEQAMKIASAAPSQETTSPSAVFAH